MIDIMKTISAIATKSSTMVKPDRRLGFKFKGNLSEA